MANCSRITASKEPIRVKHTANPLSSALPKSLKVSVPAETTGQVGFSNSGYNGVPANADTYANYFWMGRGILGDRHFVACGY